MEIAPVASLPDVRLIVPRMLADERGAFSEVWREDAMAKAGIATRFVQDNRAYSRTRGTVRGLHFQIGASAQAKLIRCTRGSVFDVALDLRVGSPTFGKHAAAVLSAGNWHELFIPEGFAHGYCTLEPDSEVNYKVSAYYDGAAERGILWNDPDLSIAWPVTAPEAVLSPKDRTLPRLAEAPAFFSYAPG